MSDVLFLAIENGAAFTISVPKEVENIKGYKMTEEQIYEALTALNNEYHRLKPDYEYSKKIHGYVYGEASKLTRRSGVYCIRCGTNGKVYVGASRQVRQRIKGHAKRLSDPIDNIGKDVKEYGIKDFVFLLLEKVDDENLLSDREIFWINKLNSVEAGYNKPSPVTAHPAWSEK